MQNKYLIIYRSKAMSKWIILNVKVKEKSSLFGARLFAGANPRWKKQNNIPNIGLIVAPSVQESRGMVQRKYFSLEVVGEERTEKTLDRVWRIDHTVYESYTALSIICMRRRKSDGR